MKWQKPRSCYPLVNIQKYGKIHHFQWENPLFLWSFSIAIAMSAITRGYIWAAAVDHPSWSSSGLKGEGIETRESTAAMTSWLHWSLETPKSRMVSSPDFDFHESEPTVALWPWKTSLKTTKIHHKSDTSRRKRHPNNLGHKFCQWEFQDPKMEVITVPYKTIFSWDIPLHRPLWISGQVASLSGLLLNSHFRSSDFAARLGPRPSMRSASRLVEMDFKVELVLKTWKKDLNPFGLAAMAMAHEIDDFKKWWYDLPL